MSSKEIKTFLFGRDLKPDEGNSCRARGPNKRGGFSESFLLLARVHVSSSLTHAWGDASLAFKGDNGDLSCLGSRHCLYF